MYGSGNHSPHSSGAQSQTIVNVGNQERNFRTGSQGDARFKEGFKMTMGNSNIGAAKSGPIILNGPEKDEMDGLDIEERKIKRIGPPEFESMETDGNCIFNTNSSLSNTDCAVSPNNELATLAKQASQAL